MRSCKVVLAALAAALVAKPDGRGAGERRDRHQCGSGRHSTLPIAIPSFGGAPVAGQLSDVVTADLKRSGLFRPLDAGAFRPSDRT